MSDADRQSRIHRYEGDDIEVTWDKGRCLHVANCVHGLGEVFDPDRRPWVMPDAESADQVAATVLACPTGALQFRRTDGGPQEPTPGENRCQPAADGPLYVRGQVRIEDADGETILEDTRVAFCRCGASSIKPFCDNSHRKSGFGDGGDGPQRQVAETVPEGALRVVVSPDGPLLFRGPVEIRRQDGTPMARGESYALCRCGASKEKPFCDGSHAEVGFTAG